MKLPFAASIDPEDNGISLSLSLSRGGVHRSFRRGCMMRVRDKYRKSWIGVFSDFLDGMEIRSGGQRRQQNTHTLLGEHRTPLNGQHCNICSSEDPGKQAQRTYISTVRKVAVSVILLFQEHYHFPFSPNKKKESTSPPPSQQALPQAPSDQTCPSLPSAAPTEYRPSYTPPRPLYPWHSP